MIFTAFMRSSSPSTYRGFGSHAATAKHCCLLKDHDTEQQGVFWYPYTLHYGVDKCGFFFWVEFDARLDNTRQGFGPCVFLLGIRTFE